MKRGTHKVRKCSEVLLEFDPEFLEALTPAKTNGNRLSVMREALRSAIIEELTPRQREMILLFYFDNQTQENIARLLGVSQPDVSQTLKAGRKRLASSLSFYAKYLNADLGDDF